MELLLKVTDAPGLEGGDKVDELRLLLQNAADHMGCALVALIVPDKNIAMMRAAKGRQVDSSLLARTHRQLLQLVTTRREAVVINRVGAGGAQLPYRILCAPVKHPTGRISGLLALFRDSSSPNSRSATRGWWKCSRGAPPRTSRPVTTRSVRTADAAGARAAHRSAWHEAGAQRDGARFISTATRCTSSTKTSACTSATACCRQIGELIRGRLPPGGIASRISGDRFALIAAAAPRGGHRVRRAAAAGRCAARLPTHANARLHVSVSIGVAALERGSEGVRPCAGRRRVGLQGRQGSWPQSRRGLPRSRRQHHSPLHGHHDRGRPARRASRRIACGSMRR